MKLHCELLLFAAVFLAVSSEEVSQEVTDFDLDPVADAPQQSPELSFREYELVDGKSESTDVEERLAPQEYQLLDGGAADGESNGSPGAEPLRRICLVVRCFPRWSKLKICWCVRWSK